MKKWIQIVLLLLVILLVAGSVYLVYDKTKARQSITLQIDMEKLEQQMESLADDLKEETQSEFLYQKSSNKALVTVSVSKALCDLKNQESFAPYIEMGKYQYILVDTEPGTEIVISDWQYMPLYNKLLSDIGLARKDQGNWYASQYGVEVSKNKPNYRYTINFTFEKGEARYVVRCYCNKTTFLDEVIAEFVHRYSE